MMMTGRPGCFSLTLVSRSMPEPPGMRMSRHQHLRPLVVVVERRQHVARVGEAAHGEAPRAPAPSRARSGSIGRRRRSRSASCGASVGSPAGRAARAGRSWQRNQDLEDPSCRARCRIRSVPWCCWTKVCASVSPSPEPPSRPDTSGKKMRSRIASRNAGAVVLDMQFQCQSIALLAERDLPGDAGAQHDAAHRRPRCARASAWQALCAMLSTAWISCSRSPRNSGIEVS